MESQEHNKSEKEENIEEKSLSPDEFSFKPKLEMMSEASSHEVRVTLPEEDLTLNNEMGNNETSTPLNANGKQQPLSFIGQYIHIPSADQTSIKSKAEPLVKQNMQRKYFVLRPGSFKRAVEDIKQYLNPVIDGKFLSAWLLAEIDHWDHEKERIVVLTDTQLLIVKYNFIVVRIEDCRRVQLHRTDLVQGGRFQYPRKTMMMPRAYQTGIRISWNKNEILTKWQRFSPFFNSPSYVTFTQHKSAFYLDTLPPHMVYEEFKVALINALQGSGAVFEVVAEPIQIEVYIGAASILHNSSDLGYSKDRGAASF